jgi:D-lactate dehydrogenase (cytochrome)
MALPGPLLTDLAALLGHRLSTTFADRALHAQSESYMTAGQPDAVVYPNSTAEVAQIAALCAQHSVPIVAWGAGTSLEGHALAVKGGVTVDFRDMNRVIAVHPEDMLCAVQPGLTRVALNHALRDTGLFFPVDPGADASLGGMASTRASGTTAVRYGTMRDAVLGLEVVLAGGEVIRTGTGCAKILGWL